MSLPDLVKETHNFDRFRIFLTQIQIMFAYFLIHIGTDMMREIRTGICCVNWVSIAIIDRVQNKIDLHWVGLASNSLT